jgi:predicted RND superfamily exporter protein
MPSEIDNGAAVLHTAGDGPPPRRPSRSAYFGFVLRHPHWVLLAVLLISAFALLFLPRLSFRTTVYDLMVEDLPQTRQYKKFVGWFGSEDIIRVVVSAENIFDPATFAKIVQLSQKAGSISGVRRVISLPEVKAHIDRGNRWELKDFVRILTPASIFQRNLISEDGRQTIITLVLKAGSDKDAVIQAVEAVMAESGRDLRLYQFGIPLVSQALTSYCRQDFFVLTPAALVVIALVLIFLFRNLHCLLLPLGSVMLALLWTFGLMAVTGVPVTMLTIIVPVFLIAVGTAYCLHICSAYLAAAETETTRIHAVMVTFDRQTFPVVLAVVTTLLGIGALIANPIADIKTFAFFAAAGTISLLLILLTFFPAVLVLLPLPDTCKSGGLRIDHTLDRLLHGLVRLNRDRQKVSLTIIGLLSAVLLVGISNIQVETNPMRSFKSTAPIRRHFEDIHQSMAGSFPMHVVISGRTEDHFETPANVAKIARLQTYLEQLPGVDKTVSFADYLKLVNYALNQYDPEYYALPGESFEIRMLINNYKIILGKDMLQRFMSDDLRRANVLMLTHISSSRQFRETRQRILSHAADSFDDDLQWEVTGLGMVLAASSHLLTMGQVKSLTIALVLILGAMTVLFLSFKVGFIAVVPNLFPILVGFGLMGLLGIPLSAATSLIAGVVIGLAVGHTIHYLVRYNVELKQDLDRERAMRATMLAVGRPIIITTVTIAAGFAVLLFSHFQPTALFALLMVVTMVAALAADLILLPVLLQHVELVTSWDLLKLMPSLGGVTPAMVHELNQPLNAIKVGSDFLQLMVKRDGPIQEQHLRSVAREISTQAQRASQMIQRLSEIGKLTSFHKTPIQINTSIRNTLEILENQLRLDNIDVRVELADTLPAVMGDQNRMVQVLHNLINNTQEAIEARRPSDHSQRGVITIRSYEDAGRVCITVSDTGVGMSAHVAERVFEPFFTTKPDGQGKGLGLAISRQIIRGFGGRITVASKRGQGTTVTISFPAVGVLPY